MSSNNLYNILNVLKTLEPKEAPKATGSKPIYESVDPKGSIMSGVKSIEQKLSEAYTAEKAKNPYAIGMASAMKSTGDKPPLKKSTINKAHEIAKKVKETAPAEKLPADQLGLDKFSQAALATHKRKLKREKNAFDLQNQMKQGMSEEIDEEDDLEEGEITKTEKGVRHRGSYGTEYQGDADEEDAAAKAADKGHKKRGRPAKGTAKPKPAAGEKKGRGRPKKAAEPTYSGGKDLQSFFGSNPAKSKAKGTVHRMDEARIMDGANETLQHVLNRFKHEVKQFEQTGELDTDLYEALFDYYMDSGEMPYGVAKARTGDPINWITDRLDRDLGIDEAAPAPAAAPAFKTGDRVMYAGKPATIVGQDGDSYGIRVDGQPGTMMAPASAITPATTAPSAAPAMAPAFKSGDRVMYAGKFATIVGQDGDSYGIRVDGQPGTMMAPASALKAPSYDEGMDAELNELAKLAGLSVAEAAKPDFLDLDKDGDKKEPMKAASKEKCCCADMGQSECPIHSDDEPRNQPKGKYNEALDPVGKEDDDVDNDGDEDDSDNYIKARREKIAKNIKEAEQMLDMMKIAGLDTSKAEAALAEAKKYGDTDVEEAPEYANSPDEEVETVDAIIHQGNDLNREKKQYADKPKAGDNPMATAESVDPLAVLSGRLQAAYESIKITK